MQSKTPHRDDCGKALSPIIERKAEQCPSEWNVPSEHAARDAGLFGKEDTRRKKKNKRVVQAVEKKRRGNNNKKKLQYGKKFDSTKGYPGEGPGDGEPEQPRVNLMVHAMRAEVKQGPPDGSNPNRPKPKRPQGKAGHKKCYICGVKGHMQDDCPVQDAPRDQLPRQMAARLERVHPEEPEAKGVPPPVPPIPEETQAEKNARKANEIVTSLRSKADLLWTTRKLDDPQEYKAILVALAHSARISSLEKYVPIGTDLGALVCDLNQAARSNALLMRGRVAGRQQLFNQALATRWERFAHGVMGRVAFNHPLMDRWTRTQDNERAVTSVPRDRWTMLGWLGRSAFIPVVEELYRALGAKLLRIWFGCSFWQSMRYVSLIIAMWEALHRKLPPLQAFMLIWVHQAIALWRLPLSIMWHVLYNLWAPILRIPTACVLDKVRVVQDTCCAEQGLPVTEVQEHFKVKWGEHECVPKFGARAMWSVSGQTGTVFRNCSCNERISITGRVGKKLKQHQIQAQVKGEWRQAARNFERVMPFIRKVTRGIPIQDFLKSFPPQRRDDMTRDYLSLNECSDKTAKGFVKREIAPKSVVPVFKDPRWIQGCPVWMTRTCGPWLRPLAKHVRKGLSPRYVDGSYCQQSVREGQQLIYTCGLSSEGVGDAFARALRTLGAICPEGDRVVILEDDQSRFDLHITEAPFAFLQRVYDRKIAHRGVRRALRRGVSSGIGKNGTRYSIPYTMQSGWPDTSVGDTIVNAAMKYHVHGVGRPWIAIVCGDDSVVVTLQSEIDRLGGCEGIVDAYSRLGMDVEAVVHDDPLDVGFCSSRFFPCHGTYVLMPKPGRLLAKIGWDMKDRSAVDQRAWLRGIASTLLHYGQIDPVLGALGEGLDAKLGKGKIIVDMSPYKSQLSQGHVRDDVGVSTYYSHHYALGEGELREVVGTLRATNVGYECDHPLVMWLCSADLD